MKKKKEKEKEKEKEKRKRAPPNKTSILKTKRRSARILRLLRSLERQSAEDGCDALVLFMTHGARGKVLAAGTPMGRTFFQRPAVRAAFDDTFLTRCETDSPELALVKIKHMDKARNIGYLSYDPFALNTDQRRRNGGDDDDDSNTSATSSNTSPSSPINQNEAF